MLTLYVCDWDLHITTADGVVMTVRDVAVEQIDDLVSLREYESNTPIEDVQMYVLNGDDEVFLPLPDTLRVVIASFMTHQHGKVDMTYMCFDFAHQAAFGLSRPEGRDADRYWTYEELPEEGVPPGSVVKFFRDTEGGSTPFAHAAVSIGNDLFLSVYGAGGDLEVSALAAMQHDFNAPHAVLAVPKH